MPCRSILAGIVIACICLTTSARGADTGLTSQLSPESIVTLSPPNPFAFLSDVCVPHAQWIPRTHTIVYARRQGTGGPSIETYDLDSGKHDVLVSGDCPTVSPDGSKLAYIVETNGAGRPSTRSLWIRDLKNGSDRHIAAADAAMQHFSQLFEDVSPIAWSADSEKLAFVSAVPVAQETPAPILVYPEAARARLNPYELHLVDAKDGSDSVVLTRNGQFGDLNWIGNSKLVYDATVSSTDPRANASSTRAEVRAFSLVTRRETPMVAGAGWSLTQSPVVDASGRWLLYSDDGIKDRYGDGWYPPRFRVTALNVTSNQKIRITDDSDHMPRAFTWLPDHRIMFVAGTETQREIFTTDLSGHRTQITHIAHWYSSPRVSSDGKYLMFESEGAFSARSLWAGPLDGRSFRRIAVLREPQFPAGFPETKIIPVQWKSTDGLVIDGYLGLPLGYRSDRRYPLIVIVHGGPCCGIRSPYDELLDWPGGILFEQMLTERGYAVFLPDYRSSGAYGFDKILAVRAKNEFSQMDFNDIMSGVSHLEGLGIADPKREYIIGHSAGSYTTNWIITHTNRFRAAVTYEGLDVLWDWGGAYGPDFSINWALRGSPFDRPDAYVANSSVLAAGRVRTPTLFINTKTGSHSGAYAWMYAALSFNHIDTQYVVYPDEPHVVTKIDYQIDLARRILTWIRTH